MRKKKDGDAIGYEIEQDKAAFTQARHGENAVKQITLRQARTMPVKELSIVQINELARSYQDPYNTYGKLKGYIDEHRNLPPEKFLR